MQRSNQPILIRRPIVPEPLQGMYLPSSDSLFLLEACLGSKEDGLGSSNCLPHTGHLTRNFRVINII